MYKRKISYEDNFYLTKFYIEETITGNIIGVFFSPITLTFALTLDICMLPISLYYNSNIGRKYEKWLTRLPNYYFIFKKYLINSFFDSFSQKEDNEWK